MACLSLIYYKLIIVFITLDFLYLHYKLILISFFIWQAIVSARCFYNGLFFKNIKNKKR